MLESNFMRKWPLAIVAVVAIGVGGYWFWSLGSLPDESAPSAVLRVDRGTAEVRHRDGDWETVSSGFVLSEGDAVRTSAAADVRIVYGARAESRLGESTEVTIDELQLSRPSSVDVNSRLQSGRIWSRIERLLDLDDRFAVSAGNVVATVRGTSFDLRTEATGTVLWVSDSAVEVRRPDGTSASPSALEPLIVSEGYMTRFDPVGSSDRAELISEESKQADWFQMNATKDQTFKKDAAEARAARFTAMNPSRPGTFRDGLSRLSERLHLVFASVTEEPRLEALYVARRLVGIRLLIEDGKSGAASQALTSLEEDLRTWSTAEDATERFRELRFALADVAELLDDVGPSSSLYRLKQKVEDFRVTFAGTDPALVAFARLTAIDARLDEAAMLIESSSLDEARNALDAARQGIGNVERDLDSLLDTVSSDRLETLRGRLFAQKARDTALRTRLATSLQPPDFSMTTSTDMTATSTDLTATSTVPTTTTEVVPVRLLVSVSPNPATIGETVTITVKGADEEGKTVDLTADATFTFSKSLGSANGPTLKTGATGTATVSAEVTYEGTTLKGSVGLTVRDKIVTAVTVRSIRIVAPKTNLIWDETMPVTVQATMSDGSTKDVTNEASLTTSNFVLGYFTKNLFHAGTTATGTGQIIATYGKELRATTDVVIMSR